MQKNPLMMTPNEVLKKYEVIKSMNTIVKALNDESGYYDDWIYTIPEDADNDTLMEIAYDEELLEDAIKSFKRIMAEYMEDGIYIADKLY